MNDFDKRIFESPLDNSDFIKITEELNNNPDFQINDDNLTDFIDCKFILDLLKEQKIEYRIFAYENSDTNYKPVIGIYISQRDYPFIKPLLEPDAFENSDEDYVEEDHFTKIINTISLIVLNTTIFVILISLFVLGIKSINEDSRSSIVFIIIGGGPILFQIIKTTRQIINKKVKNKKLY